MNRKDIPKRNWGAKDKSPVKSKNQNPRSQTNPKTKIPKKTAFTAERVEISGTFRRQIVGFIGDFSRRNALRLSSMLLCLLLTSCVERALIVKSDPPGATVYLDGDKVGETPCRIPFLYYGTREIMLEKDSYKSLSSHVSITPPAYQYFPMDFITEVLLPFQMQDIREFSFTLETTHLDTDFEGILKRARELKEKANPPQGKPEK